MLIGESSEYYLKKLRAKSKMFEYNIPIEEHIKVENAADDLIIVAISLIGDISEEIWNYNKKPMLIPEEKKQKLYFASRFFDSYYQSKRKEEMNPYYILLGAVAYYFCDMIGSSKVMNRMAKSFDMNLDSSGFEHLIVWLLGDDKKEFNINLIATKYEKYVSKLLHIYSVFFNGIRSDFDEINELRQIVYQDGTDREVFFIDIILAVFKKKIFNSAVNLMPYYSNVELDLWMETFKNNGKITELWPAQILLGEKELFKGKSGVVQMPTSSGKTASVALAIQSRFLANRTKRVIIVAPFRALCKEISYDLENFFTFDKNIKITEFSDIPESSELSFLKLNINEKQILVLTPEKMIYIIKHDKELMAEIKMIVFDEAHLFDDVKRGTDYELLLSIIKANITVESQKILVSAVIPNAGTINEWINEEGAVIKNNSIKTSERSIAFSKITNNIGSLYFVNPLKNFDEEFYVPRVIRNRDLNKLGQERKQRMFPDFSGNHKEDIGIYFSIKLIEKGSMAIFCSRKDSLKKTLRRYLDIEEHGISLNSFAETCKKNENIKIAKLIAKHYGVDNVFCKMAKKGILGHSSIVPNGVKVSMEYALKNGYVNCVVCTSTLAQGVNLPIKYLVISNVYQSQYRIKVRDFQNLIGRTGRAGKETEGTILFTQHISQNYRELLEPDNVEKCESNLLRLVRPIYFYNKQSFNRVNVETIIESRYRDKNKYFRSMEKFSRAAKKKNIGMEEVNKRLKELENVLKSLESYILFFADTMELDEKIIKQTYGYFLANKEEKESLIKLFNLIKSNLENIDIEKKAVYSKSMMGIIKIEELEIFIKKHLHEIVNSDFKKLLTIIVKLLVEFGDCKVIKKIDKTHTNVFLKMWLEGKSYIDMYNYSVSAQVQIKRGEKFRNIELGNIVELCNLDFSYVSLSLIQTMTELLEIYDCNDLIIDTLGEIIKKIRYGLPTMADVHIYELGFADRYLAQEINKIIKNPISLKKAEICRIIKMNKKEIKTLLDDYPIYFTDRLNRI